MTRSQGALGHFTTARPVAILMVFLAAVVFGWFSYRRLPLALMPELSYPTLTVRTEYPGAAPEEVENDISRPIEEALGVIGGLKRISSVSRAEMSDVVLEFTWNTKMADAVQDSLEKLDLVTLPDGAKRPLILRFDPTLDPIMELSLTTTRKKGDEESEERRVRRIAENDVKKALQPIKGVAAVRVRGGLEEEIQVRLDQGKLKRAGLSIKTVASRLKQENINVAGGTIKEGRTEYMVRTLSEYRDLSEIGETVVAFREGRKIRIKDLGEVVRFHQDKRLATRTKGSPSVQIEIYKEADANIVSLAARVKRAIGPPPTAKATGKRGFRMGRRHHRAGSHAAKGFGPIGLAARLHDSESVDLAVVADRSLFIKSSIDEVRNTAVLGGLLAILVLFLFLENVRSTLIIAVSIPISLLVTFAPLNLLGVTLNIMSLGGLALGVGMLVDSSIVVLESIYRCREEGDDIVTATLRGTDEVRAAVTASTLTSIAVFLPMVFVKGVAGEAFSDLGLAVVISLLASLLVALFFIPMLASRRGLQLEGGGKPLRLRGYAAWRSFRQDLTECRRGARLLLVPYLVLRLLLGSAAELAGKLVAGLMLLLLFVGRKALYPVLRRLFAAILYIPMAIAKVSIRWLQATYPTALRLALRNPLLVLAATVAFLLATFSLGRRLPTELLPEVHQGEFTVETAFPVGTPLEETIRLLSPVERAILEKKGHIRSMVATFGYDPANAERSDEGENTARFKVLLDTSDPRVERQVAFAMRRRFSDIADLSANVSRPVLFSFHTPIEVEVHGDDLPRLRRMADKVRDTVRELPYLADVESTLRAGAPEVQIVYDRERLLRYGLDVATVADLVRSEVKGETATKLKRKDRRIPIVVRLRERERASVEEIRALVVNPGGGHPIPIASVARIELGEGPSEVRHINGDRVALVTANIASGSLGSAVAAIREALHTRIDWPSDMTFLIAGQNEEWEQSKGSLWLALGLSIFLVYVIMAAQFESLLHPFVIMFSIPLAFLGTFLALDSLGVSLSIVVFLGMIMLAGIVVNNAIVLVDYINTLRNRGMALEEAVVTAGTVRLRPILMTTATTVLGLLPMALGLGDGAEIRTPMAIKPV